jgi:hypothetical protein
MIKPPSQQLIAAPEKLRKAVRRQDRRRDGDWYDEYAWRSERAHYWNRRADWHHRRDQDRAYASRYERYWNRRADWHHFWTPSW